MTDQPVAVDLFCGAGGMSQGLSDAGYNVLFGIDSNPSAIQTFEDNIEAVGFCRDIQTVDPANESLIGTAEKAKPDTAGSDSDTGVGDVDLVVGGPPCPTFSKVGRSKIKSLGEGTPETDDRHELYEDFLRFVDHYRPRAFVMENVQGIVNAENSHGESVSGIIESEMTELGYETSVSVVDAANFGVPQHRTRAFFIGVRSGQPVPDLEQWRTHREPLRESERMIDTLWDGGPAEQAEQKTLKDFDESSEESDTPSEGGEKREPWITVAEAILDLPPVSPEGTVPPTTARQYTLDPLTEYQNWARDVDTKAVDEPLRNHSSRGHNSLDLSLYKLLGEGVGWNIGDVGQHLQPYRQDIFPDKYKKQNPRKPASTIVAHLEKDGHMFIHPRETRSLTVREAARLQSFRDSFVFPDEYTVAFRLVGNAVPPRLAQSIGKMVRTEVLDQ